MTEARQKESMECEDRIGRARRKEEGEERETDRQTHGETEKTRTTKEGRSEKGPAQVTDVVDIPENKA